MKTPAGVGSHPQPLIPPDVMDGSCQHLWGLRLEKKTKKRRRRKKSQGWKQEKREREKKWVQK